MTILDVHRARAGARRLARHRRFEAPEEPLNCPLCLCEPAARAAVCALRRRRASSLLVTALVLAHPCDPAWRAEQARPLQRSRAALPGLPVRSRRRDLLDRPALPAPPSFRARPAPPAL